MKRALRFILWKELYITWKEPYIIWKRPYVGRDASNMLRSYVGHDAFMWKKEGTYMWNEIFKWETWCIRMWDMTYLFVGHDSLVRMDGHNCVTLRVYMYNKTQSYAHTHTHTHTYMHTHTCTRAHTHTHTPNVTWSGSLVEWPKCSKSLISMNERLSDSWTLQFSNNVKQILTLLEQLTLWFNNNAIQWQSEVTPQSLRTSNLPYGAVVQ